MTKLEAADILEKLIQTQTDDLTIDALTRIVNLLRYDHMQSMESYLEFAKSAGLSTAEEGRDLFYKLMVPEDISPELEWDRYCEMAAEEVRKRKETKT